MNLGRYATWAFDCDGVILDSNGIKTDAFYGAALPYGEIAAKALVSYHRNNGGISRFRKFEYLFQNILGWTSFEKELVEALNQFGRITRKALLTADQAPGLQALMEQITGAGNQAFVVTGGMEEEVRSVLLERGIGSLFSGIFGSPTSKDEIFRRNLDAGIMKRPAVYFGDSQYDYEAAARQGLDFVFVSGWSEFADWQNFFSDKPVTIIARLGEARAGGEVSS